ncbi:unnamed protein product [Malus baccata var. baccata]
MGGRSGPCTPRSEGCRGQAFFFEAEVQKMRVEMASMKRDAEHSLRQVISASSPFVYLHMKSFTRLSTTNVHCSLTVRVFVIGCVVQEI